MHSYQHFRRSNLKHLLTLERVMSKQKTSPYLGGLYAQSFIFSLLFFKDSGKRRAAQAFCFHLFQVQDLKLYGEENQDDRCKETVNY